MKDLAPVPDASLVAMFAAITGLIGTLGPNPTGNVLWDLARSLSLLTAILITVLWATIVIRTILRQ